MKAIWNGNIIAESNDTVVVEGNHYFPFDSVRADFLAPSTTTTVCPWKGTASYYTLCAGGKENPDAAWYYAKIWGKFCTNPFHNLGSASLSMQDVKNQFF